MGKRQITARGKHRAQKSPRVASERPRRGSRVRAMVSAASVAGVALAGAAAVGVAPTLSVSPQLLASLHYLRGTNIGGVPTEQQYLDFIDEVIDGSGVPSPEEPYVKVPYNAGFRPFSHGGFADLSYNGSVAQGVQLLAAQQPAGDVIFGYSQGAVVASLYKGTQTGNTFVLVANPSRPNGGVMQRFKGLTIPLLDVTFSGATPNTGDVTYDVARQYDGWADFPRYLWNPIAVANAFMGILLVHSEMQTELTAEELEAAKASGDSDYYQYHAGSNTHYYVIKTYPIPLLMPLDPFLSDAVIAALDAPLRAFIETAYDRSDYSVPARASFFKPFTPSTPAVTADPATAPTADARMAGASEGNGISGTGSAGDGVGEAPGDFDEQQDSRNDDESAGIAETAAEEEDSADAQESPAAGLTPAADDKDADDVEPADSNTGTDIEDSTENTDTEDNDTENAENTDTGDSAGEAA
ncbi:PE-PPE domain-containing protein [Mycobacterium sp. pW049]|uniref:PE-PPE domain-containing protein n=1 Tax=[Mycobacterium] bulgaricum TaxID=3238985 RepID=UPI00351AD881